MTPAASETDEAVAALRLGRASTLSPVYDTIDGGQRELGRPRFSDFAVCSADLLYRPRRQAWAPRCWGSYWTSAQIDRAATGGAG